MNDIRALFRGHFYIPTKHGYRDWQKAAAFAFDQARRAHCGDRPFVAKGDPLEVRCLVVTKLAKTHERKTVQAMPKRRWQVSRNAGDFDNLAKGIADAGNGVLWHDDSQIAAFTIEKVRAAQGEAERTEVMVWSLPDSASGLTNFEQQRRDIRASGRLVEAAQQERANECPPQQTGLLPF